MSWRIWGHNGGVGHRVIGRLQVLAQGPVILTLLGSGTLNGGVTWFRGLSVFAVAAVTVGLWAVRVVRLANRPQDPG